MTTMQKASDFTDASWFQNLIAKEPKVYSYLDKVLSIDIKACKFTLTELARRKLSNNIDSFWSEDIIKFIHLMEITYCIYLSQDGESRELDKALRSTTSSYKDRDLRYALCCLHLKLGMLNFRFDQEEVENDLRVYIEEIRPTLWKAVSKRFELSCLILEQEE